MQNNPNSNWPPRRPAVTNKAAETLKNFARKNTKLLIILAVVLIGALILLNESFFIVGEAEQAVVSRFGVIKSIILDDKNTFHERFSPLLKDEITSSGAVAFTATTGLQ